MWRFKSGDSGSISLTVGSVVSDVGEYMMGIMAGSWDDGASRYVIISADPSSDGDWELMSLISISTSSRTRGSISLSVWFSTWGNGGY